MDPVNEYAEIVKKYTQSQATEPKEPTDSVLGAIHTPTVTPPAPTPAPPMPPMPEPQLPPHSPMSVEPKPNVSIQMDPPLPPPMPHATSGNSAMVSFFKLTTFLSFILLVIVCTKLVLNFQTLSKPVYTTPTPSVSMPTPTTPSVGSCILNDQTYALGQTFPAQDGCNTCTCATNDNIVCTQKACISTSPAKTTTKPTSTTDKTFTSKTFGFKFNYPNFWIENSRSKNSYVFAPYDLSEERFKTDPNPCSEGSCILMYMTILPNTDLDKIKLDFAKDSGYTDIKEVTVGGKKLLYSKYVGMGSSDVYMYPQGKNVLNFMFTQGKFQSTVFDSIIGSIK